MGRGGLNRLLFSGEEAAPTASGERVCTLSTSDPRAVHIRSVLRAAPGTLLRAAVANEGLCDATVLPANSPSAGSASAPADTPNDASRLPLTLSLGPSRAARPLPAVALVLAMPRPRAVRRAVRIAAQLGVDRIVLTGAARVERSFFEAKLAQQSVLDAAAADGVMQAAVDARVPPVCIVPKLWEMPAAVDGSARRVVLHPDAQADFGAVLQGARSVVVAVGPEGGWLDDEVRFLERHGFVRAALGPRILASEVAVSVAVTLAHAALAQTGLDAEDATESEAALVGVVPRPAPRGPA